MMISTNNVLTRSKFVIFVGTIVTIVRIGLLITLRFTASMKSDITGIYEKHMKRIDFLIEADRDAYQSSIAISQIINVAGYSKGNVPQKRADKFTKDINENPAQIGMRFHTFAAIHESDEFRNINKEPFDDFETNYAAIKELTPKITGLITS